jgi:hypothetical protein
MITPAKVPSQSGPHREVIPPPSSAKSQSRAPPTASLPKTRDQPEEPNWKRSRPAGNNASIGISRMPPTRQQKPRPTSDRPHAPHVVATTTGSARTRPPNSVAAAVPAPLLAPPAVDHSARNMRMHSKRRWQDRQHIAESGSCSDQGRASPGRRVSSFAAGLVAARGSDQSQPRSWASRAAAVRLVAPSLRMASDR